MTTKTLSPADAAIAIANGARLIDIRDPQEHAREKIAGATNVPLDRIETLSNGTAPVIFHCRTGMRTDANAPRLIAAASGAECYLLEGGIDQWRKQGFGTEIDRKQPIDIMRQVQITAGILVLLGVFLGAIVHPAFYGLSAFVGAGLTFAGATGWCGMAKLLGVMPWNRVQPA